MDDETQPGAPSLEQVLASQQATIERLERELRESRDQTDLSQQTLRDQGRELHEARVNRRVAELQDLGVPPATLTRYKELALAAYSDAGAGVLQLSIKEGDSMVTKDFGPIEQAEYLLASMPLGEVDARGTNVVQITRGIAADAVRLAQQTGERIEPSVAERADAIERRTHPERFNDKGERIPLQQRRSGQEQAS